MHHLHIDCFSGISGDMFLGALVDAGLPLAKLKRELRSLPVQGYRIAARKVRRGSIQATKVDVVIREGFTKPLSPAAIRRLINTSGLPTLVKTRALHAFGKIAEAEGCIHGVSVSRVMFHEVGVMDSLIDIVGAFLACAYFDIDAVSASPVNVGSGTISSAHGVLPVPGPAVAQLAKGIPIFSAGPAMELTTPTGLSILRTLTDDFRPLPPMEPQQIGYGAGTADPKAWPNVVRVFLSPSTTRTPHAAERLVQVETTVDDLIPQAYEHVMDCLFQAGALDVTLTPVIMKRGRPGIIVTALAFPDSVERVASTFFRETTTLGIRFREIERVALSRRIERVKLGQTTIRLKVAQCAPGLDKIMPEYRDCKGLAEKTGRPLYEIMDQARQAFLAQTRSVSKG